MHDDHKHPSMRPIALACLLSCRKIVPAAIREYSFFPSLAAAHLLIDYNKHLKII